ncbi:MAG TPA: hypothetical protein VEQ40_04155 [Pyrinomonadaceae bacterium]|nr:hypothetical protein [Pyrinomonadaceae bacterium]
MPVRRMRRVPHAITPVQVDLYDSRLTEITSRSSFGLTREATGAPEESRLIVSIVSRAARLFSLGRSSSALTDKKCDYIKPFSR